VAIAIFRFDRSDSLQVTRSAADHSQCDYTTQSAAQKVSCFIADIFKNQAT